MNLINDNGIAIYSEVVSVQDCDFISENKEVLWEYREFVFQSLLFLSSSKQQTHPYTEDTNYYSALAQIYKGSRELFATISMKYDLSGETPNRVDSEIMADITIIQRRVFENIWENTEIVEGAKLILFRDLLDTKKYREEIGLDI